MRLDRVPVKRGGVSMEEGERTRSKAGGEGLRRSVLCACGPTRRSPHPLVLVRPQAGQSAQRRKERRTLRPLPRAPRNSCPTPRTSRPHH